MDHAAPFLIDAMEIRRIKGKEEMLRNYTVLLEMYPGLSREQYSAELDQMLPHNYGQVAVFVDEECIGLTGFWIGHKLWCGKYLELDNIIIPKKHRSRGIGKDLFEYMQQLAIEEKCTLLALDSYTDNFPAHKFFYNQGYVPRGFHFIHVLNKEGIR